MNLAWLDVPASPWEMAPLVFKAGGPLPHPNISNSPFLQIQKSKQAHLGGNTASFVHAVINSFVRSHVIKHYSCALDNNVESEYKTHVLRRFD